MIIRAESERAVHFDLEGPMSTEASGRSDSSIFAIPAMIRGDVTVTTRLLGGEKSASRCPLRKHKRWHHLDSAPSDIGVGAVEG